MANGDRLLFSALDLNGRRIKEVGAPVAPGDAANKAYVDAHAGAGGGGGAAALGDLTDVDVTEYPPGPGDQLVWWPEQQKWVPAPRQRITNLLPMNVATGTTTAGTVDGFSAKVGNGVIASVTEPRWRDVYRSLQIECTPGMNSPEVEIVPVRFPAGTAKIGYSFYLYAESAGEGQFTSIAGGGVWLDDQGLHVNSVGSGRPVKAADAGTWVRHVWSLTPPEGATQFRPKITVNGLGTTGNPVVFVSGLQVQVGEVTPWVADSGGPAIADASDVVVDEAHAPDGAVLTWSAGAGVWIAAEPAAGGGEGVGEGPWPITDPQPKFDFSGVQVCTDGVYAWLEGVWSPTVDTEVGDFQSAELIGTIPEELAAALQWPISVSAGWADGTGMMIMAVLSFMVGPDSGMGGERDGEPQPRGPVWAGNQLRGYALGMDRVVPAGTKVTFSKTTANWLVGEKPIKRLADLDDVNDHMSPMDGHVLTYSGGSWTSGQVAGAPQAVSSADMMKFNTSQLVVASANGVFSLSGSLSIQGGLGLTEGGSVSVGWLPMMGVTPPPFGQTVRALLVDQTGMGGPRIEIGVESSSVRLYCTAGDATNFMGFWTVSGPGWGTGLPLSVIASDVTDTPPVEGQVLTAGADGGAVWADPAGGGGGGGYPLVVQDVDPAYDMSEMFVFPHGDGWEGFGKVTVTDPYAFKANPAGTWILTGRLPAGIDPPAEDVVATIFTMMTMVQIDAKITTTGEVYTAYIKGNSMALAASASVQRGLFLWGQTDTGGGGGASGPTITAQGDATQSSGKFEVQDAGAAYPTWHVYSEGSKTVMGWGGGTSAPQFQMLFQTAEYGDTMACQANIRTQKALELQTTENWTIHRLEATPETVTLNGSPIMTEASVQSLVDEVAALRAEVQGLRSRLGDGA